jgi:hypothetical protein
LILASYDAKVAVEIDLVRDSTALYEAKLSVTAGFGWHSHSPHSHLHRRQLKGPVVVIIAPSFRQNWPHHIADGLERIPYSILPTGNGPAHKPVRCAQDDKAGCFDPHWLHKFYFNFGFTGLRRISQNARVSSISPNLERERACNAKQMATELDSVIIPQGSHRRTITFFPPRHSYDFRTGDRFC